MPKIECEFECPHCGQEFTIRDGMYRDDVEDEVYSTCECCGGVYQLRCISVEVEMEAIPVTKGANDAKQTV